MNQNDLLEQLVRIFNEANDTKKILFQLELENTSQRDQTFMAMDILKVKVALGNIQNLCQEACSWKNRYII